MAEDVSASQDNLMDDNSGLQMDRRTVLRGASLVAGALAASGLFAAPVGPDLDFVPFLARVGEIVIPTTKTPGAGAPPVSAFVINASKVGIIGSTADVVPKLIAQLDARAGRSFMSLPKSAQTKLIQLVDTESFQPGALLSAPWPTVKALIVMGYYTSEVGGSQELDYQLVPGRYDPDIPIKPGHQAMSNDWSGLAVKRGTVTK